MTNQLASLQCPSCGGLLRSIDAQVWQCAHCESRYLYGDCWPTHVGTDQDVDPYTGMLVLGELSELQVAQIKARMALESFGRKFGKSPPILVGESGPEIVRFEVGGDLIPSVACNSLIVAKWNGLGWNAMEA